MTDNEIKFFEGIFSNLEIANEINEEKLFKFYCKIARYRLNYLIIS